MDDTWRIVETDKSERDLARRESLFSLGNGYLGFRGFFTERRPAYHPGIFLNGFYELTPILYGEHAYGLAKCNQTMLDLPDCRFMEVALNGETFHLASGTVHDYRRELNFRTGVLTREVSWTSPGGTSGHLKWESLISLERRHIGAMRFTLETDPGTDVRIRSTIALPSERPRDEYDPRVSTKLMRPPLEQRNSHFEQHDRSYEIYSSFETIESKLSLLCGVVLRYAQSVYATKEESEFSLPYITLCSQSQSVTLEKVFYYHSNPQAREVRQSRSAAQELSWEDLVAEQKQHLDAFWHRSDVEIQGDDLLQRALRFNLFQLYQSTGKDGRTSLAAKGLTGGGYEGHYFWDTEIYGMPFFTFTTPDTARSLIAYRISILERAIQRAEELSQRGALFPWRTINGMEASAYYPAGTAQYHINADIAYSIFQYLDVTGDRSILTDGAARLLCETSRLWEDLGFYNPARGGAFCINEVTGPDEYSALVNNNFYTNVMAQYHLLRTVEIFEDDPGLRKLAGTDEEELELWRRAGEQMYIPFDRDTGIHPQDDSFLERERWDFEHRPRDKYPLLLYYHPLVIYRYQVLKQADAVLALLLLSDRYPWYQRRRDFTYYEPLTTGDSSLSACIQGIVAYDCGYPEEGLKYCRNTSLMDIEDLHKNTKDGLHTAAMAGSWMSMVFGVAGFRYTGGIPRFRPVLPDQWSSLTFPLTLKGIRLEVQIEPEKTTYRSTGGPVTIYHRSDRIDLDGSESIPTRPQFKGAVFDLDGVITSTDEFHFRAWKQLADRQGWHFDQSINRRLRGVSRRESLMIILRENNVVLGEDTLQALTDEKNRCYRSSLEELTQNDILPGISELLETLRGEGILLAVASASRNASFILEQLGLQEAFDAVVPAGEVILGKPDCEVFARAADMLGLWPEECVGIEDAEVGIISIKEAMMKAVGVGEAVKDSSWDLHVDEPALLSYEDMLALFR